MLREWELYGYTWLAEAPIQQVRKGLWWNAFTLFLLLLFFLKNHPCMYFLPQHSGPACSRRRLTVNTFTHCFSWPYWMCCSRNESLVLEVNERNWLKHRCSLIEMMLVRRNVPKFISSSRWLVRCRKCSLGGGGGGDHKSDTLKH